MKTPKNESILSGLLAKNPVWNEISGGDAADLADSIEKGEWIGLMVGTDDDTDAGWDKYIADTFGPFADFVEGRYIKPDEDDPDFRVAQIKFKPLFNRLSTNAKTGLLADLGDVLKSGYFAESKDGRQNEYFPQGGIAKHWNGGHWYERNYVSDRRLNTRIRLDGAEELIRVGGIDPIHATSVLGKALVELHPRLANGVKRFDTMVHDYMNKKEEPAKNYVCDMVRELLPKAIPAIEVLDVKTAWRKDPDGISEGISPKLALRKKLNTVDGFLKDLPCFHEVLGKSAKDLYDKGFDLDVAGSGLGDKADAEKEAKRTFDDFDEYIDYSLTSEKEDGKDYWYALVKFKPAFWDLADGDLHEVLKLLEDAISEYC